MYKVFLNSRAAFIVALAFLPAMACSDMDQDNYVPGNAESEMMPLALKGMPFRNSQEDASDRLSEVSVFHFNGSDFILRTDVADPYADGIKIQGGATSRIFCVSGTPLSAEVGVTKQEDFALSTVHVADDDKVAPLFYSGFADLDASAWSAGQLEVGLVRSVARIDFVNEIDTDVKVSKVVVMDAPAESFVFSNGVTPSDESISFERSFDVPFRGSESGLFYIFESDRPVHVRILGEYGDSPLNVEAVLQSVERNMVYTLQMVNVNSKLEGAFTVKKWEDGVSIDANPGIASGIYIDKVNSKVPEGVKVDYNSNRVDVPASGVSGMKLAFLSSSKVSVASIDGGVASAKISANDPVKVEEGYISSFNVDIDQQPNGASSYSVIVHLRDESGKYNFVEITVPRYHYIETVNIAGSEWMCFNAVSADPDDQVFPFEGISVEEMYQNYWVQSIGNFFQYGRQLGYNPWTRNDPEGNSDTERNIPWTSPECMPVPQGYHVASAEEWFSLLPAGTTIPSTYTAGNGEEIRADLIILPGYVTGTPSLSANRANIQMRYVRFESMQSGNVLILPICGQKTASWDEYPASMWKMHECVCYWIADDRCVWYFRVSDNDGVFTVNQEKSRWNYDGFLPVRGIKNAD